MRLKNILIVVEDLERSVSYYKNVFGLQVKCYQEGNVMMTEGLVLQDKKVWQEYLEKEVVSHNNGTELYFEENDIESLLQKLAIYAPDTIYLNPLKELPSDQKMMRFYDLDGNLIEVRTPV